MIFSSVEQQRRGLAARSMMSGFAFPHRLAAEPLGHGVVEAAVGQHRAVDLQPVADAGVVVVLAVARARCGPGPCRRSS